jgi:hypothetical protein
MEEPKNEPQHNHKGYQCTVAQEKHKKKLAP